MFGSGRDPVSRKQVVDADARLLGLNQHIADVVVGIDPMHLAGPHERLKHRQVLSTFGVAREQEIFFVRSPRYEALARQRCCPVGCPRHPGNDRTRRDT